jgi:hypothetical protein
MKFSFEISRRTRALSIDRLARKDSHAPAPCHHSNEPSFRPACATGVRQAARAGPSPSTPHAEHSSPPCASSPPTSVIRANRIRTGLRPYEPSNAQPTAYRPTAACTWPEYRLNMMYVRRTHVSQAMYTSICMCARGRTRGKSDLVRGPSFVCALYRSTPPGRAKLDEKGQPLRQKRTFHVIKS